MPESILRELCEAVGLELRDGVAIEGRDPVLATRFRLGDAAAAALAACGAGVADLWELRTGRRQHVRVSVRAAAASLLSFAFQRLDGRATPRPAGTHPTVALYPTRDGRWIHLHGGFPHLAAGTLRVLGCASDRDSVAAAVARRDAPELEEALAAERMCGAMVRTAREWAAHPQGRALAKRPPVEVLRVGDGPRVEGSADARRPLQGVRVLDLTRVLAGPTCARTLAEHGAEVLKVTAPHLPSVEPFVIDTGHGKRSAHLDLREPEQAARLRALVRDADVFSQGYRTGALERRGFGVDELVALRPGLIYVSIDCYGHDPPWGERPGWEQLAQTVTGLAADHGAPGPPGLVPAAACDYTTGYLAALGVLVALARRARDGGSYHVRASLCQTGMWLHRHHLDPGRDWPAPLGPQEIAELQTESSTPRGRIRHLAPVVQLSETPARWEQPTVPLGTHAPEWC